MKKQIDLPLLATLAGAVLFNFLFWSEKQALNLLIYSLFICIVLLMDKEIVKGKKVIFIGCTHLLTALLVVVNDSNLNVISWYISFGVFIGFAHSQSLRSVFTALLASFLQFFTAPVNLIRKIAGTHFSNLSSQPIFKSIKYIIIPIVVLIIFSFTYSIANPVFAEYLNQFTTLIGSLTSHIFNFFFSDLSFSRFMHIMLGLLFTAAALLCFKNKILENAELTYVEILHRKRKAKGNTSFSYELLSIFAGKLLNKKMALKTENIIGILSFTVLNLLLMFLNAIDIATLWLAPLKNTAGINYSAELHEGTNALILSIVMAMLVILYFFNGNLNFYSKNKTIRSLAYIWIIQNGFLVLSVLLRDYHYIDMHGLTYKRIGVLIFLLLSTIGLVTVYIKVAKQKTFFYLCKVNSFIWYILLLVFGFVNWDVFIVRYNINNKDSIQLDLDHLTDLSDKTLPLLDKNRPLLKMYLPSSAYYTYRIGAARIDTATNVLTGKQEQISIFDEDLNERITHFEENYAETTWLSWNYRDWQTHRYLSENKKLRE